MTIIVHYPENESELDSQVIEKWKVFEVTTTDRLCWAKPRNWGGKIGVELHFVDEKQKMYWHFVEGKIKIEIKDSTKPTYEELVYALKDTHNLFVESANKIQTLLEKWYS